MRIRSEMSVHRRMISLCAVAVLLTACSTLQVGHDFDINAFESRVQRGVTTREQVHDWLGAPTNTGIAVEASGNREEQWTYYFAHGRLPGMANAQFKTLQVRFNSQGKVVSYTWSSAAPKGESAGS
jgi:outer membrane protein assembly factor BamE (lipoprotein component of BamABCDE complex)